MIDQVLVFSKTGIVLWSKTLCKIQGNPVDEFVGKYVISERTGDDVAIIGPYALKWTLASASSINLFFLVISS
jgi:signal recognition particle receptor subunit alpha